MLEILGLWDEIVFFLCCELWEFLSGEFIELHGFDVMTFRSYEIFYYCCCLRWECDRCLCFNGGLPGS